VFEHVRSLGLEGIVSKRKDSRYVSGRSPYWLKMKNPASAAVKREAEEDRFVSDHLFEFESLDGTERTTKTWPWLR
jgi:hypothetical protein